MSKIMIRRTGLGAALGAALIALLHGSAQAQDWPSKTVTVIVPFAAGGNTDVMARMASNKLANELKQTFVVENRVGAGGAIAANFVAQAAPDGYALLFGAAPQIAIVPRIQKVNYDPLKSFAPVSVFGTGPFILAVNATIPVKTLPEFVAYGRGRKLNYGSGGVGSIGHLSGALLVARAGFDSVHIPFSGGGPATSALVAGQIDMYFGNASELIPQAESGKIKLLGVATDQRMKQIPTVPTISETFPNFALSSWNGFLVPAATPRAVINKLATLVAAAARDPAIVAQLESLGITPNGTTPEEFAAQIAREQPLFDEAIAAAGMKQN
jgi:tripartite-type tricarboxylate transporter receptor subunit TctC